MTSLIDNLMFIVSRRNAVRAAIVMAALALGACAGFSLAPGDAQLAQWREQHRYATALAALDAHKDSIAGYEQKRATILDEAYYYQAQLLRQADALVQQQKFTEAQALIDPARTELPASTALERFDSEFNAARDLYLQRWLDDLVQLRAPDLVREHAIYQAMSKAATSPELQNAQARHQADIDYLVPLIAQTAKQALARNENAKAAQYFAIANQLKPSPEFAQQLRNAERMLVSNKQKREITRTNEREQRYQDLRNALAKSLQERKFFAARNFLAQARALNTHSDEFDALQRDLDNATADFIAEQVDAGNRQYADGQIEAALQSWRSAYALMPTPDLQEKIGRAQKFIENLRQLQKTAS